MESQEQIVDKILSEDTLIVLSETIYTILLIEVFYEEFNSHYFNSENPYEKRAEKMMQELVEQENQ